MNSLKSYRNIIRVVSTEQHPTDKNKLVQEMRSTQQPAAGMDSSLKARF